MLHRTIEGSNSLRWRLPRGNTPWRNRHASEPAGAESGGFPGGPRVASLVLKIHAAKEGMKMRAETIERKDGGIVRGRLSSEVSR